jgi:hypothetical protein
LGRPVEIERWEEGDQISKMFGAVDGESMIRRQVERGKDGRRDSGSSVLKCRDGSSDEVDGVFGGEKEAFSVGSARPSLLRAEDHRLRKKRKWHTRRVSERNGGGGCKSSTRGEKGEEGDEPAEQQNISCPYQRTPSTRRRAPPTSSRCLASPTRAQRRSPSPLRPSSPSWRRSYSCFPSSPADRVSY